MLPLFHTRDPSWLTTGVLNYSWLSNRDIGIFDGKRQYSISNSHHQNLDPNLSDLIGFHDPKLDSPARNQPQFTMIAHDQHNKFIEVHSPGDHSGDISPS